MCQLTLGFADGVRGAVTRGSKNPLWFGLSGRLKQLRLEADIPAMTLGNIAGVASTTAWRIERDESRPGIDVVEKIAIALGVAPCWLAFGADGEETFQQKIPRLVAQPPMPRPEPVDMVTASAFAGCGERLRLAREAKQLSMRDVAKAAGLSPQAVSLVEAGKLCPRVDTCEAMAVALDVAPCWLAYGVGRGPIAN